MSEIADFYQTAKDEAAHATIAVGSVPLGALPERLDAEQSAQVLSILQGWGFAGNTLQPALAQFAQHYNASFNRGLNTDGRWGTQPRFAMEIYHLAQEHWRESIGDTSALAFTVERGVLREQVEQEQTAAPEIAEIAKNIEVEYNAVASLLAETGEKDPYYSSWTVHSVRKVEYVAKNGTVVPIGVFNMAPGRFYTSENDSELIPEGLLGVVRELDPNISSFEDFAHLFNERFNHRDPVNQMDKLLADARSVDARWSREDILLEDIPFENMRYAVAIWIAHERLPKSDNDPVRFGDYEFNLAQLQALIPRFRDRNKAVIQTEFEAKFLQGLVDFAPDLNIQPLSTNFTKYETQVQQASANYQQALERYDREQAELGVTAASDPEYSQIQREAVKPALVTISPAEWAQLAAEIEAQDFAFAITGTGQGDYPALPVNPDLVAKAQPITERIDKFIALARQLSFYEEHSDDTNSLGQLVNAHCHDYEPGSSSYSCYDGP